MYVTLEKTESILIFFQNYNFQLEKHHKKTQK